MSSIVCCRAIKFIERLAGVAIVSREDAFSYNLVGPNAGLGDQWDIRRDIPYSVYPELEFEVLGTAHVGKLGDSFDRYWARIREMQKAAKSYASA